MEVKIEYSGRHVHLTGEDFKKLFGEGELTPIKKLSQEDDFAAKETVCISGPGGSFKNVRIVGPFRKYTQAEVSKSDSIELGVLPPLKVSGDLPGCGIEIVGPEGKIVGQFCIIAQRHLHCPPEESERLGLSNGDGVSMKITEGPRRTIFYDIIVRVAEKYTLAVHMDTDEANATFVEQCSFGNLIIKNDIIT